jgi:hypothetical protein
MLDQLLKDSVCFAMQPVVVKEDVDLRGFGEA